MRLMLLRHAKAEKSQPGQRDRDRRLAERGHRDATLIGAYMKRHRLNPDAALVSPATRTRETFERIAAALGKPPQMTVEERLYDASPDDILAAVQEADAEALLVVGHNPGLHELAAALIAGGDSGARERLGAGLPTCGLVAIEFDLQSWAQLRAQSGRLERFVTPRLLAAETE